MRRAGIILFLALAGCGSSEIRAAKDQVRDQMRDPSSVQFEDVVAAPDGVAVCGYYNAKNGYGAYVGFERFVVVSGVVFTEPDRADFEATQLRSREAARVSEDAQGRLNIAERYQHSNLYEYRSNASRLRAEAERLQEVVNLAAESFLTFNSAWDACHQ